MRRTIKYLLVMLPLLAMSCSGNNEFDERWTPMEWQHAEYPTVNKNGHKFIVMPSEGGSCTFRCKNYGRFWISNVKVTANGNTVINNAATDESGQTFESKHISVRIDGNQMTVTCPQSDGTARDFAVTVSAGDIFGFFYFEQK